MFQFTRKPSSGSHSHYLAKITHLVQCGYIDSIRSHSAQYTCLTGHTTWP